MVAVGEIVAASWDAKRQAANPATAPWGQRVVTGLALLGGAYGMVTERAKGLATGAFYTSFGMVVMNTAQWVFGKINKTTATAAAVKGGDVMSLVPKAHMMALTPGGDGLTAEQKQALATWMAKKGAGAGAGSSTFEYR
jgi:hypothetical protein